jgi:hypothetical protein
LQAYGAGVSVLAFTAMEIEYVSLAWCADTVTTRGFVHPKFHPLTVYAIIPL